MDRARVHPLDQIELHGSKQGGENDARGNGGGNIRYVQGGLREDVHLQCGIRAVHVFAVVARREVL